MRFSLSTNWCNRRFESGEEIADKAMELGFSELELGFHTSQFQVKGFKARLGRIPVGSVHAFCPVPISAPQGYPELYQLASFDEEDRKMAKLQILRNVRFAAEMGADTVVLHAGRVNFGRFLDRLDSAYLRQVLDENGGKTDAQPYRKVLARADRRRRRRGEKMLEVVRGELSALVPVLEKEKVTLALENMPYFEGFPRPDELQKVLAWDLGGWVKGWYDTGHARVAECFGWDAAAPAESGCYAGMHLNDVESFDDNHFAPGRGKVDFAALKAFAKGVRHVVFEPNADVSEKDLAAGLAYIRKLWGEGDE